MQPPGHLLVSIGVGVAIYGLTNSATASAAAAGLGVLIDLDHLFDYLLWASSRSRDKLYLWLHSYELLLPLFLWWIRPEGNALALGLLLGAATHLLTDQLTNRVGPFTYFVVYRMAKGFRMSCLVSFTAEDAFQRLFGIPLIGHVLVALIRRWAGRNATLDYLVSQHRP